LTVLSIGLHSCSKTELSKTQFQEFIIQSQLSTSNKNATYNTLTINGVTTYENTLHFEDMATYKQTMIDLRAMQESDNDIFNSIYLNMPLEELASLTIEKQDSISDTLMIIEKEIKFSEQGIYEAFETALSFNSLRDKIFTEHLNFLNNAEPNWDENPDNHFIGLPEIRAAFNVGVEIRIGNSVFIVTDNYFYEITYLDGDLLDIVREYILEGEIGECIDSEYVLQTDKGTGKTNDDDDTDDDDDTNTDTSTSGTSGGSSNGGGQNGNTDCKQTKNKFDFKYNDNDNNKKIEWEICVDTWWWQNVYAKTTNYREVNFIGIIWWETYKTYCEASVHGVDCANNAIDPLDNKKAANAHYVWHLHDAGTVSVPNYTLHGGHFGANGAVYNSLLSW